MTDNIRQIIAKNLKRLRKERGHTQDELAHLAGLDKNHPGNIEREECNTSVETIEKLAKALGVDPDALLKPLE